MLIAEKWIEIVTSQFGPVQFQFGTLWVTEESTIHQQLGIS